MKRPFTISVFARADVTGPFCRMLLLQPTVWNQTLIGTFSWFQHFSFIPNHVNMFGSKLQGFYQHRHKRLMLPLLLKIFVRLLLICENFPYFIKQAIIQKFGLVTDFNVAPEIRKINFPQIFHIPPLILMYFVDEH